jgi:hypothetical protein
MKKNYISQDAEIITQIHYLCKRLGEISNLVFIRNDCQDLNILLEELRQLDKICIKESE